MSGPLVCLSPAGNLWLLLEAHAGGKTKWLQLETGEVRWQDRPLSSLLNYGWRVVAGEASLVAIE